MKLFLLFCCCAALLASAEGVSQIAQNQLVTTQKVSEYKSFQPSKVVKQKKKLRQRVSGWGWGVAALTLGLMAGLVWLVVWLWPMVALGWQIVLGIAGLSLVAVLGAMGLFLFTYAYPTQRDIRFDALHRLEKLTTNLTMTAEKGWCLSDEYFRLSIAADSNHLLVVDYIEDRAWMISKNNIVDVKSDFTVPLDVEKIYPQTPEMATIITRMPVAKRSKNLPLVSQDTPMQVLQFQLRDLPLRQLTLVYRGNIYSDSTQNIAAELRSLWQ